MTTAAHREGPRYYERYEQHHRPGQHLGRHIHHDDRSAAYAEPVLPRRAIKSVTWNRHTPILNQGNLGACVPNDGTAYLACDARGYTGVNTVTIPTADSKGEFKAGSVWNLDEKFALNLYRLVTRIDPYSGQWEPTDTGSDNLSLAKALVQLGLATAYTHAFSYTALVSALQKGPVMIGSEWENSMFTPGPDGKITVDFASGVAGGHSYLARQFDADNDRVWIDNSWDESWGLDGRAWFQGAELTALLKRQGDVTVPALGAAPTPPPSPVPADRDRVLASAFDSWRQQAGV